MKKRSGTTINAIAAAKGWTVEAVLANPYVIDLPDHRAVEFLKVNRPTLEAGLSDRAKAVSARERLWIGNLLLHMGSAAGSPLVLQALASADPVIVGYALTVCSMLPRRQGRGLTVPLDEPAAAAALRPLLEVDDPVRRQQAIDAMCKLSDARSVSRMVDLLTHNDQEVRRAVAQHLALYHGDERAWPEICSLFRSAGTSSHKRYHLFNSLVGFARHDDKVFRQTVAAFARRELGSLDDKQGIEGANEVYNVLRVLESLAPEWEAVVLQEVIASSVPDWVKEVASDRLESLAGSAVGFSSRR